MDKVILTQTDFIEILIVIASPEWRCDVFASRWRHDLLCTRACCSCWVNFSCSFYCEGSGSTGAVKHSAQFIFARHQLQKACRVIVMVSEQVMFSYEKWSPISVPTVRLIIDAVWCDRIQPRSESMLQFWLCSAVSAQCVQTLSCQMYAEDWQLLSCKIYCYTSILFCRHPTVIDSLTSLSIVLLLQPSRYKHCLAKLHVQCMYRYM